MTTFPDGQTRFEWVKMFYPDAKKGIIVGIIHQVVRAGGPVWVFDHRTDDSQGTADSPMGIDVGTLRYLASLQPSVTEVHFLPHGSPALLTAPLPAFAAMPSTVSTLGDGSLRTRVFLPRGQWTPVRPYPEMRPAYWAATHLREDGHVIVRHAPKAP